jgi:hypothetical protein
VAFGPLNAYHVRATVGVALYNGRTKEFLGRQTFSYWPKKVPEYHTYSGLEENIGRAMPVLRVGLLELVPAIANVISKDSPVH